jgi:hypothetical protein
MYYLHSKKGFSLGENSSFILYDNWKSVKILIVKTEYFGNLSQIFNATMENPLSKKFCLPEERVGGLKKMLPTKFVKI